MRTRTLHIQPAQEGRTVESLLHRELAMSDSHIARLKRRPLGICLNGQRVYTNARVTAGDILVAEIGDFPVKRPQPMACPLSVLYEDDDMLLLNKQPGIAVHASTRNPGECTLENALAAYLPETDGLHPVSRLDRGTSGVMTWAKNGYMHQLLRLQAGAPQSRVSRLEQQLERLPNRHLVRRYRGRERAGLVPCQRRAHHPRQRQDRLPC